MTKKILTPAKIGNLEIKNRVMFPSMCMFFCDDEGHITEEQSKIIVDIAKGGAGLIVLPGSPHGKPGPGRPALSDDSYIPGWATLAAEVQSYGAKLFCQLHPAAVQAGRDKVVRNVEDYDEAFIKMHVDSYAACALRAKRAGIDGVEIHGAHAHEIAQFLSPHYNKRNDEYGTDYKGRSRYSMEIVRAIKASCGADFPVEFRISGDEMVEGGRKLPETIQVIKLLIEAGIDAVHVSIGMPESEQYMCAPMDVEDCFNVDAARRVKAEVDIPVIAVGRISSMEEAEAIIERGDADFVAIGRAQLADPALVNKFMGTDPAPVRRCIGCNQGCRAATKRKKIRCMQNSTLGRIVPKAQSTLKDKRIMVVGAGPAGLEAALTLAEMGAHPSVYDKNDAPGGLILLAEKPPFKKNMHRLVEYRAEMLESLRVCVHYGTEVDEPLIRRENPDILIVATGSLPFVPKIAGIDGKNVHTGDEVLQKDVWLGERIAVLGGGLIGCEVAEELASKGKKIDIFEMRDDIATDLTESRRIFMLARMRELGIQVHTETKILKIVLPEIVAEKKGTEERYDGFDSIVVAAGRRPNDSSLKKWREAFPQKCIVAVGDVAEPGLAIDAIETAMEEAIALVCGK